MRHRWSRQQWSIKVTKLPIEGIKSTQIHAVSLNLNYWSKQIFMLLVNVKSRPLANKVLEQLKQVTEYEGKK